MDQIAIELPLFVYNINNCVLIVFILPRWFYFYK